MLRFYILIYYDYLGAACLNFVDGSEPNLGSFVTKA